MAGKRQATSNLNHENWDQEDEPEERGTFRTAPPEELKSRVIKKATRRKPLTGSSEGEDAGETPSKTVFSGFSGFGKPATAAAASGTPFAFLSNLSASASAPAVSKSPTTTVAENPPKPSGIFAKNDVTSAPPAKQSKGESNLTTNISNTASTVQVSATPSIFGNTLTNDALKAPASMLKPTVPADKSEASGNTINASKEYRDSVAELNMAVMKFLQEHMDKNPYCILSPVFESYDKYAKELREKDGIKLNAAKTPLKATDATATPTTTKATATSAAAETATTVASAGSGFFGKPSTTSTESTSSSSLVFGKQPSCTVTSGGTTTAATTPLFSFGTVPRWAGTTPTKSEATSSTASPANIFSFGTKPAATAAAAADKEEQPKKGFFFGGADPPVVASATGITPPKSNGFTFGVKNDKPITSVFSGFPKSSSDTAITAPSGFFSSSSSSVSFANAKPNPDNANADNNEDEEDKPPVVEFNKVVEDDAVYSKRCKVFVKKENDFVERGVGTLYLKPVKDSEKMQMLVRADTNLGNILVNLLLTSGLPCKRMGKNNVMMVCLPTPEESKPMSMLLRVKTGEDADQLYEEITKHTV
ncbi:PREDICTED: nuclear pore complex protein Nup50 [Drosophila arizonae]|uniref:Nuclear pore complex protein Nup50 n=1 Tax=Drosophila arizonae TaxID=7263 RepID=A0ABM1PFE8_DROAR|nr:PREDICTED: nuclear pore complex protein Nup50 [Drosophila arizonae]